MADVLEWDFHLLTDTQHLQNTGAVLYAGRLM
jgi:hypothetical protein